MEKTVQAWQKPEGQGPPRGSSYVKIVNGPHFVFPGAGNGDAWKIGVRSGARTEALQIITGSTGAGKTSVLAEASDIPALQIVHAAVDLDGLGLAHLPSETANDEVMYGSLQSACRNCASRGRERFWLARNGRAR